MRIRAEGVTVRYRISREKPWTVQEYIINRLKGKKIHHEMLTALNDVTFELAAGETLGVIGRNGAGKSTLLKVLAGVLKPSAGNVVINGTTAPLIELGAGFDMELTGAENIFLNASILGLSKRETEERFKRIVEFSELAEFIYSPLKSYSSGMVARLGFAIATEVDPDILLVDEILAVGDEHFRRKCNERIGHFRETGTCMLLVSHNVQDILDLCDRVLWLDHGIPIMYGNPQTVTAGYLGMST